MGGLVAATASLAAACTASGVDRRPAARQGPSRAADPDVALAATVLADERAMLDRVVATVRAHPRLADVLAGARATHRSHVELLTKAVPDDEASPTATPSAKPPPARVPGRAGPALSALARAEDRLGLVGRRSASVAESGAFARVLASMAAAAAQQSVHLASAAQDRR